MLIPFEYNQEKATLFVCETEFELSESLNSFLRCRLYLTHVSIDETAHRTYLRLIGVTDGVAHYRQNNAYDSSITFCVSGLETIFEFVPKTLYLHEIKHD